MILQVGHMYIYCSYIYYTLTFFCFAELANLYFTILSLYIEKIEVVLDEPVHSVTKYLCE